MPPKQKKRSGRLTTSRPHGSDDVDVDVHHESSPPLGCIRLPYKRPFYTLALHQHEVEQDIALITNFKRRRATRGNCSLGTAMPDDMMSCAIVLMRLRNHGCGLLFSCPVQKALWPESAKELYQELVNTPLDLGIVQGRLSSGGYSHSVLFSDDVRMVFRNAAMCSQPGSDLHEKSLRLWKIFEEDVVLYRIAATEPVIVPKPVKPTDTAAAATATATARAFASEGGCMRQAVDESGIAHLAEAAAVKEASELQARAVKSRVIFLPVKDGGTVSASRPRSRKVAKRRRFAALTEEAGSGGSGSSASDMAQGSPESGSYEGTAKMMALADIGKQLEMQELKECQQSGMLESKEEEGRRGAGRGGHRNGTTVKNGEHEMKRSRKGLQVNSVKVEQLILAVTESRGQKTGGEVPGVEKAPSVYRETKRVGRLQPLLPDEACQQQDFTLDWMDRESAQKSGANESTSRAKGGSSRGRNRNKNDLRKNELAELLAANPWKELCSFARGGDRKNKRVVEEVGVRGEEEGEEDQEMGGRTVVGGQKDGPSSSEESKEIVEQVKRVRKREGGRSGGCSREACDISSKDNKGRGRERGGEPGELPAVKRYPAGLRKVQGKGQSGGRGKRNPDGAGKGGMGGEGDACVGSNVAHVIEDEGGGSLGCARANMPFEGVWRPRLPEELMGKLVRRPEKTLSHAMSELVGLEAADTQLGLNAVMAVNPCAGTVKGSKPAPQPPSRPVSLKPSPAQPLPRREEVGKRVPLELIVYSRGSGGGKGSLKPGAGYPSSPHNPSPYSSAPSQSHKASHREPQTNSHKSSATGGITYGSGGRKTVSLSSLQYPRSASSPPSRFAIPGKPRNGNGMRVTDQEHGAMEPPPRLVPVRTPGEALLAAAERVVPGGRTQLAVGRPMGTQTPTWGARSHGINNNHQRSSGAEGGGGGDSLPHAKDMQGGGIRDFGKACSGVQGYLPAGTGGESDGSLESNTSLVSSSGLPAAPKRQHTRTVRHGPQSVKGNGNQMNGRGVLDKSAMHNLSVGTGSQALATV